MKLAPSNPNNPLITLITRITHVTLVVHKFFKPINMILIIGVNVIAQINMFIQVYRPFNISYHNFNNHSNASEFTELNKPNC